jgi:hypothetical protein
MAIEKPIDKTKQRYAPKWRRILWLY